MNIFSSYTKINYYDFSLILKDRLKDEIPQIINISSDDIANYMRGSGLIIYKMSNNKVPFYIRITLPFAIITMILMLLLLPVNFIFTGRWRYNIEFIASWFRKFKLI
jgi:hypothetical protein